MHRNIACAYVCLQDEHDRVILLKLSGESSLEERVYGKTPTNPDEFWREQPTFLTLFRLDDIVRDFIFFRIENNDG